MSDIVIEQTTADPVVFTIDVAVRGQTGATGATGAAGSVGPGYGGTSASSITMAIAVVSLTTQAGLAYVVGSYVRILRDGIPNTYMEGEVTYYSGTLMQVDVAEMVGTGTYSAWNLTLIGEKGATGATGATGAAGAAATIAVGTVTLGPEESDPEVTNSGTSSDAVFDFTIPAGASGRTGPGYLVYSSTSRTIGVANGVDFSILSGTAYVIGSYIRITSQANTDNYMTGVIQSYTGTSITVDIDFASGSGTHSDWSISITGPGGSIGGVYGLTDALAGKASTSHTHAIADTTGLQTALDTKVGSEIVEAIFASRYIAYTDFGWEFNAGTFMGLNTFQVSNGTIAQTNVSGHSSAILITVGTTAVGVVGVVTSRSANTNGLNDIQLGVGKAIAGGLLQMSATLASVGTPYTVRAGFANNPNSDTAGVFFRYDQTQSVWQAVCKTGGVETVVNTDITVAVSTTYRWRIEINAAGNQALFYLDWVLKATIATNIPTGTSNRVHGQVELLRLSNGATSSTLKLMRAYWIVED